MVTYPHNGDEAPPTWSVPSWNAMYGGTDTHDHKQTQHLCHDARERGKNKSASTVRLSPQASNNVGCVNEIHNSNIKRITAGHNVHICIHKWLLRYPGTALCFLMHQHAFEYIRPCFVWQYLWTSIGEMNRQCHTRGCMHACVHT